MRKFALVGSDAIGTVDIAQASGSTLPLLNPRDTVSEIRAPIILVPGQRSSGISRVERTGAPRFDADADNGTTSVIQPSFVRAKSASASSKNGEGEQGMVVTATVGKGQARIPQPRFV